MRTIRGRLTLGFSIALAAAIIVLGATALMVERSQEREALDARIIREADLIASIIVDAAEAGPVLTTDTVTNRLRFVPGRRLETVQDYVIIFDTRNLVAHTNEESLRALVPNDVVWERLQNIASNVRLEEIGTVDLGEPVGSLRYIVRRIDDVPNISRIFYAAEENRDSPFVAAILVTGPIILIGAVFVGYLIAGRTLDPMDTIINEIEAITDGRSLHRRVVELDTTDELQRLGTTLNNMLKGLERSFMSLRRFTADASHELKTPLTVLRAGVERAITHPEASPEVLAVLEETLVEVNRMTELVDSLLTLARADEGRAPLHLEREDLRVLLGEVAETGSMLGEQARVDVEVHMPDEPLEVEVDRSRARQLFMNLLTNAIKYTPAGGRVRVWCERVEDDVVLSVADTGIGMGGGELEHVFDRFWRADVARSRWGDRAGVGLGLAISKWIAEAHGGTIAVTSQRGKGSVFTVTLPISTPAPA